MPEIVAGNSISPAGPADPPFTWEVAKLHLKIHSVTEEQLTMLEAGYSSPKLALCTATLSSALTCFVVLLTVQLDGSRLLMFFAAFLILALFTVYFGIDAYRERHFASELGRRIRGESKKP